MGIVPPKYSNFTECIDPGGILLKCKICGQVWSPNLRPGGRLPRGSFICPNNCTKKELKNLERQ